MGVRAREAMLLVGRCTLCSLPWHRSGSHQARETSRAHSTHRRPHAPPPAKPPRARSTCSRPHPRGSQACTLPCGHLFGLSCIVAELRRRRETPRERRERSECPICRQGAVEQQVRRVFVTAEAGSDELQQRRRRASHAKMREAATSDCALSLCRSPAAQARGARRRAAAGGGAPQAGGRASRQGREAAGGTAGRRCRTTGGAQHTATGRGPCHLMREDGHL